MTTTKQTSQKNVYQKIQQVRVELQRMKLKKTGVNTFSKFNYYELSDFLPQLNVLLNDHGLTTQFSILPKTETESEHAFLLVRDSSNPEDTIAFKSPTAEVQIGKTKDGTGGAMAIQNLGGKITYMRRYMLMMAFEIVESDYVDPEEQNNIPELDDESISKINEAKTLEELALVCKMIKKDKPELRKSLVKHYTKRKEEIENETV